MKNKIILSLSLIMVAGLLTAGIRPTGLTCEYLNNPQVLDVQNPRLSWINTSENDERGQYQTSWEIRAATTLENLLEGKAEMWNSGRIYSSESVNIRYEGKPLLSRQKCWWQVKVWDKNGKVSDWSEPAFWIMGILDPEEWKAQWIGAPWQDEDALPRPARPMSVKTGPETQKDLPPPAPMLRKTFALEKEIASARAYVTGLGFFELYANGKKVGKDVLIPNLTLYGKRDDLGPIAAMINNNYREYRVMYLSYDLKEYLRKGENAIGAILGNGFYNPSSYWCQGYGSPRFLCQIYLTYTDGSEQIIISDGSWKASESPIAMDLIYDGEHYDARLEQPGWCLADFDDSEWENAGIRKAPSGIMKAHMSPTDRVMEILPPLKTEKLGEGRYRIDFGEEISGWVHLMNVKGDRGRKIEIKYICESPVGDNYYIMAGGDPESYSARFTWFVFREVEITNWPGELKPEQIRAEAVYTNVETTGKFECSNPLFNRINRIWWRSQTDNMHGGIASDCPHRERSPYTGDGQVACVTVMHNFDARAFYSKWIRDIYGAQNPENGYVPNGAPWQPGCGGGVGWGAAMNIMPWEFYLHYGDREMLSYYFDGMMGYIRYMLTWTNEEGIMFSQAPSRENPYRWINLGDWVAPGPLPPDQMVHTFFLWRCSDITAGAAKVLGKTDEYDYCKTLAEKVKKAFQKKYYDEEKGTYGPYGGNIFALRMGIPEDQKKRVIAALVADIHAAGDHLDTGIFGTQFFFEVLSDNGLHELAYKVINQKTQPSYGWWIEQGATTTWEQWNGTNSRNHPMFGGGIVWFYRKLAGMNTDPENPGYKHIIFMPQPANDITFTTYSNFTPYGEASISWKKDIKNFITNINVPVGSSATVYVPAKDVKEIRESGRKIRRSKDITFIRMEHGYAIFEVKSGSYSFASKNRLVVSRES
jgi:alpha-L-rhamnosidase